VALTELIIYISPPFYHFALTLKMIWVMLFLWLHTYVYACMTGHKNTTPYLGGSRLVRWPMVSSALCPVGRNNQHLLHGKHSHAHSCTKVRTHAHTPTHCWEHTFQLKPQCLIPNHPFNSFLIRPGEKYKSCQRYSSQMLNNLTL